MTNKPHHSTIMHMYADGSKIECKGHVGWYYTPQPSFNPEYDYRVLIEKIQVTVLVLRKGDRIISLSCVDGDSCRMGGDYTSIVLAAPLDVEITTNYMNGWTPVHRQTSYMIPDHLPFVSFGTRRIK